ncbi:hypothetical protein DNTS_020536 [Danionella cerebrum]|uniref:Uncharacterized protein n=1 Tax=Danionella cerebrum TaxID=2873325 RepID=A0A553QA92_9TELE|nr:hypothetical protein DNTS_020536 [Danionella translucida]
MIDPSTNQRASCNGGAPEERSFLQKSRDCGTGRTGSKWRSECPSAATAPQGQARRYSQSLARRSQGNNSDNDKTTRSISLGCFQHEITGDGKCRHAVEGRARLCLIFVLQFRIPALASFPTFLTQEEDSVSSSDVLHRDELTILQRLCTKVIFQYTITGR